VVLYLVTMVMVIFMVLATLLTFVLVVFGVRLQRALRRFRIKKMYTAAITAPSVSVCIPARNETHAMTQCLERVLASDYKKLEIVVYDDSSRDDTSILIRSFAHAGVRFVPGTKLPPGWLGRNHALDVLAREASGTYLLFLDVDTFIQSSTVSSLVGYVMSENLKMASVIPGRSDIWRVSVLFGHLRYFWELILSTDKIPAASGAAWMIDRHTLIDTLGGLAPYKNIVLPESHLAAALGTAAYHCVISNQLLGVTSEKKWRSQVETSQRLLLPMVGGTWLGGVVGLIVLILLNLPLFTILSAFYFDWTIVHAMALWLMVAFMGVYGVYTSYMWSGRWWLGGLLWPIVIFQEMILFIRSIWGYILGKITWKGRAVSARPLRTNQNVG
jgi:glycosyltransferase involved in cell wall biosynthesis